MKKLSVFLLAVLLLAVLVLPVFAADETASTPIVTAPPMPTVAISDTTPDASTDLPENLGSVIGVSIACVAVVAIAVVAIVKKRK